MTHAKKKTPPKRELIRLARRELDYWQHQYHRAEKALIRKALVGCLGRDPSMSNQSEASSSGRHVDLRREVGALRFARNEITNAERDLRTYLRKRT